MPITPRTGSSFHAETQKDLVGAGRYERSDGPATHRNGYRECDLETRLGTVELKIPKLRRGS
jgi:putative transposase